MSGAMGGAVRVVRVRGRPRRRVLMACAMFGVALRRGRGVGEHQRAAERAAGWIDRRARGGRLTLIVGPSGSGKSTILRALSRRVRRRGVRVVSTRAIPRRALRRALVELVPGTIAERLGVLSAAGLGEAMVLAREVGELSEGQRARAVLAAALARAERMGPCTLLIDEFTSGLDAATARSVAASLARWAARARDVRVVAAGSRDELARGAGGALVVGTASEGER